MELLPLLQVPFQEKEEELQEGYLQVTPLAGLDRRMQNWNEKKYAILIQVD